MLSLLIILVGYSFDSFASDNKQPYEEKLWELNLAAGIASLPHYIGSNQHYTLPLIFPYIIYRGEILKADKKGLRGRFFESGAASIDIDFSFGLPVRNSKVRQGMPNLGLVGQVGPQMNWVSFEDESTKLSFHVPWRIAIDNSQTYLGWVLEPGIQLDHTFGNHDEFTLALETELLYASKKYSQYYYGVDPKYATISRPTYDAKQGYHYTSFKAGLGIQHSPTLLSGIYISAKTLKGSNIVDSPLVKTQTYLTVGIGFTWTFMTSDENAPK